MAISDDELREFVMAIIAGHTASVAAGVEASPELVRARFQRGATREQSGASFIDAVERYIVIGDSALHFAAAAYQSDVVGSLIRAGAEVRAQNCFGDQPLHSASLGNPNSERWNPAAQVATVECLIAAGADPNAVNKRGVTPLHIAVRTRCADVVRVLLHHGADAQGKNMNGSTPLVLAKSTTGRGGTGSIEAKVQQREILRLLEERFSAASR